MSLREIYQNKQRADFKRSDWEGSVISSPSSPQVCHMIHAADFQHSPQLSLLTHSLPLFLPQVLTLDPGVNMRQSDRTSGFTSPSHFSSPSFATQPHLYARVGTPVTPDSMVESSPNPGDTDCISDTSSVSAAGPSPYKVQTSWGNPSHVAPPPSTSQDKTQPRSHKASHQRRASAPLASEEEGSHTHTSTLKPGSASGVTLGRAVSPHMEKASSLEDPVVLSL